MQVPERLALIGGSILLASTLIFTLKSQVSQILPKWENTPENIDDDNMDITNPSDQFFQAYKQAQQKHWQTGHWGTSRFYIDDQHNMHVSQGTLSGTAYNNIGKDSADNLQNMDFDGNVELPVSSRRILGDMKNLTAINGTEKINTSHTEDLFSAFSNDVRLTNLDLNSWDVSHTKNLDAIFANDPQLSSLQVNRWNTSSSDDMGWLFYATKLNNLDLSHWDTSHVRTMFNMFAHSPDFQSLNLSGFDTTNTDTDYMFGGGKYQQWPVEVLNSSIKDLTLGDKTRLGDKAGFQDSDWHNGNATMHSDQLNGTDNAGTWTR